MAEKCKKVLAFLKKHLLIEICIFLLILIVSYFSVSQRRMYISNFDMDSSWFLTTEQGQRGDYTFCDATEDHLYFSYIFHENDTKFITDVYDNDGNFLYSIFVFDTDYRGFHSMRCSGESLYINTKNLRVYEFHGKELIRVYNSSERESYGFTWKWFRERNIELFVDDEYIYRLDENGNKISQTPKPPQILEQQENPETIKRVPPVVGIIVIILVFGAFIGIVVIWFRRVHTFLKSSPRIGPR